MNISKFNSEGCCSPVGSVKHRPNRQVRPFDPTAYGALSVIDKEERALSGPSFISALPLPETSILT